MAFQIFAILVVVFQLFSIIHGSFLSYHDPDDGGHLILKRQVNYNNNGGFGVPNRVNNNNNYNPYTRTITNNNNYDPYTRSFTNNNFGPPGTSFVNNNGYSGGGATYNPYGRGFTNNNF